MLNYTALLLLNGDVEESLSLGVTQAGVVRKHLKES
jgi:hypothetical protein